MRTTPEKGNLGRRARSNLISMMSYVSSRTSGVCRQLDNFLQLLQQPIQRRSIHCVLTTLQILVLVPRLCMLEEEPEVTAVALRK